MDFPYGGDPVYRVSLLDKNDAVPSPRVVKLAVAFQLSGPGCHLGSRPGQVLVDVQPVVVLLLFNIFCFFNRYEHAVATWK